MKLAISAGHNPDGKIGSGAIGLIKESTEARKVVGEVIRLLTANGHTAYNCTVDNGTSQTDILNKLKTKHNAITSDMNISIHFNSGASDEKGNGKTTGVEVLVYNLNSDNSMAKRVCDKIASTGQQNRGLKERQGLAFLKGTKGKSMLIECCFVDDADDVKKYNYKTMAKAIVEGILNKTISDGGTSIVVKYKVLVDALDSPDGDIARIFKWKNSGIVIETIDSFKTWSAENLYIIGGTSEAKFKAKGYKDNYTVFNGTNRYDTLDKAVAFQLK